MILERPKMFKIEFFLYFVIFSEKSKIEPNKNFLEKLYIKCVGCLKLRSGLVIGLGSGLGPGLEFELG